METIQKLIDEVLRKLDWDLIMKYFESTGVIEDEPIQSKKRVKRVQLNMKSLFTVKKELTDLIKFVIESNFDELQHDNWIISWTKGTGCRLEVVFTPTRVIITENFDEDDEPILNSDIVERDVLTDMLNKAVLEENYELAAVIHSRLKKLDKLLLKAPINKKDIY